jgi:UDP-N-acetylglucosamine--N-acetylmuramyl-(pentapeptide) pyrophosphoryl-undecaprenol N-acetylglucosamine transferase
VLRDVRADAVVGFGGYASLPAYLAARRLGVAIVLHEANAKAGVANRVGARLTRHVAVSTSGTGLPHATLVGVPLREEITELDREASRSVARKELGLDHDRPTLLVFGGSQGARRLNDAAVAAAPQLAAAGVQVLHAAGPGNTVELPPRADNDPPYVVVPYLEHIERAYAAADLALCRSGAMSCAELAAVGLPAVFVPYPFSNQEQRLNAAPMVQRGGALLVDDADLTGDWVVEHVLPLVTDPEVLRTMSERAQGVGGDDAVARLVAMVDDALGER